MLHDSCFVIPSRGFTLIELLTVIAIIGILMGFLTVNFIGVRQRSRDAQRKSDLRQIQSALELYRSDNDAYPTELATSVDCVSPGTQFTGGGTLYMQRIPCDPQQAAVYSYILSPVSSLANCSQYQLAACVENTGDTDSNIYASETPPTGITSCSSGKYYVLCNP